MLNKIPNIHKLVSFRHRAQPNPVTPPPPQLEEEEEEAEPSSAALRIVHVGGTVECYYMAILACIMKKYPNLRLARSEVFRRPWESLVRTEEILTPGEKFLLVPKRTVRKVRKRIGKQSDEGEASILGNMFAKGN